MAWVRDCSQWNCVTEWGSADVLEYDLANNDRILARKGLIYTLHTGDHNVIPILRHSHSSDSVTL